MIYRILFITSFLFYCSLSKPYKINKELNDLKNKLKKLEKENIAHEEPLKELLKFKKSVQHSDYLEAPYKEIQKILNRKVLNVNIIQDNEFLKKREKIIEKIYELEMKKNNEKNVNINPTHE